MAFLQLQVFSSFLTREVSVNALIPMDRIPYKTVYLFHGLCGSHGDWMRFSNIERYALSRGIAVIMPNADRSFYADTAYGENYFSFVSTELPAQMQSLFRGMSSKKEDNYLAGLSMGGYGALKIALSYPEKYNAVCSLSGALNMKTCADAFLGRDLTLFEHIFGSKERYFESRDDLLYMLDLNKKRNIELPKMFLSCGDKDPMISATKEFYKKATDLSYDCSMKIGEGGHEWAFWDREIQPFLEYIAKN